MHIAKQKEGVPTTQYDNAPARIAGLCAGVTPGFLLFGVFEQGTVERNIARQSLALADEMERCSTPVH